MKIKSNYDKSPAIKVDGKLEAGWESILNFLKGNTDNKLIAIECYQGVNEGELKDHLQGIGSFIDTKLILKDEEEILRLTQQDVTDDAIFGFITRLELKDFIDTQKLQLQQKELQSTKEGITIVCGPGAFLCAPEADIRIYADMARWEIQQRMRRNEVHGLGVNNCQEALNLQYKRGFFVDWRVCDKFKKDWFHKCDYLLDTNKSGSPKLVDMQTVQNGLSKAVSQPIRVVPFFDPGPWGGHWMEDVCDLDTEGKPNHAWCFDCVPEENSLLLSIGGEIVEIPSVDLVFFRSSQLLGEEVEGRFGQEFPIRFDFLDTMGGGNLSLQVHPDTTYIQQNFGMNYTQDESYYMLDAKEGAVVYLGMKKGINQESMIDDLKKAQEGEESFDANKYVNTYPAKKHDHFLIPAGTVHCSGMDSMVLEISATPYIFTFKMWDWGRLGLDGKPRPINIEHASKVIDWSRDAAYAENELINQVEKVAEGEGWIEERTGLHKRQFIETRRHWFSKPVVHNTQGGVNVLNLVEGTEAIIESPQNLFEPYIVHYAETFIIPAAVGEYSIRPYGKSEGETIATIKAFVRAKA